QLPEPDLVEQAAGRVEQQRGGVQVDGLPARTEQPLLLRGVPAQAHPDPPQRAAAALLQRNLLPLAQADGHGRCCLLGVVILLRASLDAHSARATTCAQAPNSYPNRRPHRAWTASR